MNTYTNVVQPKKKVDHKSVTVILVVLALITVIAIAAYLTNRPVVVAGNNPTVAFSNALEMQYAQPWLQAHSKPIVVYSNALEGQYAQPWLQETKPLIAVTGSSEMPAYCLSNLETLYACKYGYLQP